MIPWTRFNSLSGELYVPDVLCELRYHNLIYVDNGPTMSEWALDNSISPMLESALERQFAVTQLGGTSNDFRDEHVVRITECLDLLQGKLQISTFTDLVEPSSPYSCDVIGLLHPVLPLRGMAELDLEHGLDVISTHFLPEKQKNICPVIEVLGHETADAMNTEPATIRHHPILGIPNLIHADLTPSPPSTLKEILESAENVNADTPLRRRLPYARADHHPPTQRSRSLKPIKIRRESKSRSSLRAKSVLKGLELEDKGP